MIWRGWGHISCMFLQWIMISSTSSKHCAETTKFQYEYFYLLTHWGRMTHICVGKLTIIGSDNGLSPERRQVIIWTNAGILSNGPLGTSFSEILIEIYTYSFKKMHLKISSGKWRPFCLGLNVLTRALSHIAVTLILTEPRWWGNNIDKYTLN